MNRRPLACRPRASRFVLLAHPSSLGLKAFQNYRPTRFNRALLSSVEAPKISNRFMEFALNKGQVFEPGALRWAFAFLDGFITGRN